MKFQSRNNYIINWPEYPLLRITVCFILGIYISDIVQIPLNTNFYISGGLFLTLMFFRTNFTFKHSILISSVLVLLLGVSLGMLRSNLQKGSNSSFHYYNQLEEENIIVGRIESELRKKKRISTTLQVLSMDENESRGKLLVYFGKGDSVLNYQIGDVIIIKGRVQKLKPNPNPRSFDYKEYLKYKCIDYQVFLKDGSHEILEKGRLNLLNKISLNIRNWALSIFENRLNDKDHLATASAMVLGYKEHLSEDLYTSFSETGAVHVLAVSGLHVGIICMIFIFIFNRFKNEDFVFKMIKLIVLLSVVWTYAFVTGASPAVLRAAVMFSLILVGRLWFKGANIYNILAFSALILLLFDPYLLFQLSFQFSYLALISIVFFQPYLVKLIDTKHWISTKIWQLTTVSIAAQILIFPISVYHFHTFPTYFILSGISAVFLATFILGMGLFLLGVNDLPFLGDIAAQAYSILLEVFLKIISGIQSLPFNNVDGVYISKINVALLYLIIGIVMFILSLKPKSYKDVFYRKIKRKRISKLVAAACILFLFMNSIHFSFRIKANKEMIVYDISRGTVIDFFYNNKLYTIQSPDIEIGKVDFATKSYRIYNGNPEISSLDSLSESTYTGIFQNENGSVIFKNKHLVFVDKVNFEKPIPCISDLLLVVNNTKTLPYRLLEYHRTELVVLDSSLSFKVRNQWVKECEKRGIKVHDIRRDGVFRM